tara:strand:- start:1383 stop:1874 length:492 start_codon:yes stop_codon:yes gene_type:complete
MSTKNTLNALLTHGFIKPGDTIHFNFKRHEFTAQLLPGGILANAHWIPARQKQAMPCFMDRAGFDSLTDWCDSCIQELIEEYATRFSGWKRCKHKQTGTPMAMLRAQLQDKRQHGANTMSIEQQLAMEQKKNVFLTEQLRKLQNQHKHTPTVMEDDNPFKLRM